jgi:hypothetical protein
MPEELEPISPQRAREILDAAIRERLGDEWDDEEEGWVRVTGHDYMARLTRGSVNLDFYVDLLGNVRVERSGQSGWQQLAGLLAVVFIALSLVIALLLARIASGS